MSGVEDPERRIMAVVLTHNAPESLERCLRAITGQTAPPEAVLVETASVDTLGNALFCRALLAREGLGRVLLVTDRSHLPRALYTFRRLGVPADPAPAPAPPWSRRQVAVHLREAAALVTYLWRVERAR